MYRPSATEVVRMRLGHALLRRGILSGVRGVPRHGLYDIYCSAHHDQCSLIILSFLAAWRGGCGPAS
jgi:hypothetical protein